MENKLYRWSLEFPLFVQYQHRQQTTSMHTHNFVELVCVSGGKGRHLLIDGEMPLKRGDVFVIPRGVAHGYITDDNAPLALFNLFFIPEKLPLLHLDLFQSPGFKRLFTLETNDERSFPHFQVSEEELEILKKLFNDMIRETSALKPVSHTYRFALLMQLMCRLSRLFSVETAYLERRVPPEYLTQVKDFMKKHYKENCSIQQLAKMVHMSKSKFMSSFKLNTGISPMQYLLDLRLTHACRQLTTTAMNISEIAFDSGFNDSNYFTRTFHKHLMITPRAYRKQNSIMPNFLKDAPEHPAEE